MAWVVDTSILLDVHIGEAENPSDFQAIAPDLNLVVP